MAGWLGRRPIGFRGADSSRFLRAVIWLVSLALAGLPVLPAQAGMIGGTGFTEVDVCTNSGTIRLVLDAEGQSVPPEKAHPGKSCASTCPTCAAGAGVGAVPKTAWLFAPAGDGRCDRRPHAAWAPPHHFLDGNPHRGPPAEAA